MTVNASSLTFVPSFESLKKLGDGATIVQVAVRLHTPPAGVLELAQVLDAAREVLYCFAAPLPDDCAQTLEQVIYGVADEIPAGIGTAALDCIMAQRIAGNSLPFGVLQVVPPVIGDAEAVQLARDLIHEALTGGEPQTGSEEATGSFDVDRLIGAARMHLGLPLHEAQALTMREFCMLMQIKYPEAEKEAQRLRDAKEWASDKGRAHYADLAEQSGFVPKSRRKATK